MDSMADKNVPDDLTQKHLSTVGTAMAKMIREIDSVLDISHRCKTYEHENEISESLGRLHSLAENALNDYRVNRKVAFVDAKWREFTNQEQKPE